MVEELSSIRGGKAIRALRGLGLTEYEASAYLTLLHHGEMTAMELSERAAIPYSKVYGVLDSLRRRGWLEISGGRPRMYSPRSPMEALQVEWVSVERSFEKCRSIIVEELQPIYEGRGLRERPEVWIIRGLENILSSLKKMVEGARRELMMALPTLAEELLQTIYPPLSLARDRGVRILLLTTGEVASKLKAYAHFFDEVRVRDEMFGGGVITDGAETLLILDATPGGRLAIASDHKGLTGIAKVYFNHLWKTARSL
jgi:sugar-specific transcriptional regulator TrmB